MRRALGLLAVLAVLPGAAPAADDPACAKYGDPLAYNACLASHGPRAKDVGRGSGEEGPPAAELQKAAPAAEPREPARRRTPNLARRRGRIHMEFLVR